MKATTLSRALLVTALLASGLVHAVARPTAAAASLIVDGDGVPAGLSPEEEEAWAFAHLPVIHVRP